MLVAELFDWRRFPGILAASPLVPFAFNRPASLATRLKKWIEEWAPGESDIAVLVKRSVQAVRGPETYWRAFLEIYEAITGTRVAERRYWVEKTPWNERFVPFIDRFHHGECRYLHLLRDPRAVIASTFPARLDPAERARLIVHRCILWSQSVHWYRYNLQAYQGRYFALRYEDLVTDTYGVMGRVCRFLDLPLHETTLDVTRLGRPVASNSAFPVDAPPGAVFASHTDVYEGVLAADERQLIESLLHLQMRACGYSPGAVGRSGMRAAFSKLSAGALKVGTLAKVANVVRRQRRYRGVRLPF
jgi:hypothetical protein